MTDIDSVDTEDWMTHTNLLNTCRNSRNCASMNGIKCSKTKRSNKTAFGQEALALSVSVVVTKCNCYSPYGFYGKTAVASWTKVHGYCPIAVK